MNIDAGLVTGAIGGSPEFAQFGRDFAATGVWRDPFGRPDPVKGPRWISG